MNLDRFNQPLHGETFFDDAKVICTCEHCEEDLHEGHEVYNADDMNFCDKDCFIDWAIEEFNAGDKVLEGENE